MESFRSLSIVFPIILTFLLPPSITPDRISKIIVLGLLLWLGREIRIELQEYLNGRRARARGAWLAPRVHSKLPFGLSTILRQLRTVKTGTPGHAGNIFDKFPTGTQVIRRRELGNEIFITRNHLDANYVLTTAFARWGKSPRFKKAFSELLGEGIFTSDQRGLWSWHRALTRSEFTHERTANSTLNHVEEHASRIVVWLDQQASAQKTVNIQDVFSRFTLTVSTQQFLGHCVDSLNALCGDRPPEVGELDPTRFAKNYSNAQKYSVNGFFMPDILRWLREKIYGPNEAIECVLRVIETVVARATDKAFEELSDKYEDPANLLDRLRRSGCSAHLLRHELLNVMLAARDSTTSILTSCLYELARRDQLWGKLRAEVEGLREASFNFLEQVRKLKLLRAVINEALRLHPPVWFNIRHSFEDDVLPSGAFVPAGSDCHLMIREFQRDPEVWGKDAEDFVPERWLDGRRLEPSSYQPFSAGPRSCLGKEFAYIEVSIVLIRLLLAFSRVELAGPSTSNFKEFPGITLSVRGGLWVRFHK
ncbi:hypothetical protein CROQUDRAFT_50960 [Cronartium quercuum f. sp. fusiforme G11]|uniref:Cytochrome P450 n=1 Tax=Cronartium quercuum f. sp. fusiforme G11 TaxID=708437 RepID=A0A9P6NAE3_9BASI|nr:hypothetical protein CROQUDRAFT_50960 [Cronartium quercuum f. sp. fusiforme G11]